MATTYPQREGGLMIYPRGWLRWAVKAPILLWRLGFGPILGRIFMLLTTTGRKSGLPRRTMVEYHMLNGRIYAPCAFGPKAQWYKNIVADPRVTVQTAHGVQSMIATRVTDDEEILAVYELLRRRDPVILDAYLRSLDIRPDPADVVAKKDRIYWLRFDPTDEPTPPPLEADLAWVWPVVLVLLLGLWLLRRRGAGG
ncbi:MAG: nitroreductase family deazaflavin-dependent oxidoreductase [Chloroflexi bacterium]|nr:nitroreductase family deazaflavin-dependent oxidoreductase [Chloroflexota bacterium]